MIDGATQRTWWRSEWALHLAVAAISLGLAVVALRVWEADFAIPWSDAGDAIPVAAHFKTVLETGWYEFQPLLGAPFGQQYHDFPSAETTNFVIATVLSHLFGNWAVAMNVAFLLSFPLAGAAASWFVRVAGGSRLLTLAVAPVFAILPYHFVQGEPHLFISMYFIIPLGLVLALRVGRGEAIWGWRDTAHPVGRWFGRGLQTVAIAVLVGSTDTYYAVFVLIMLAAAGVFAIVRDRSWSRFSGAIVAGVLVIVVMALNMLPDWIHTWTHGPNPGAFQRTGVHAEYFALKLTQLLLPWPGHRIGPLADLRAAYDTHYPLASEEPSIGAISAIGFLLLLGYVVYRAFAGRRAGSGTPSPRVQTLGLLAGLVLIAFLFGTLGGIDSVISLITPVLRSWNRIAVVIALLGLTAIALLLDAAIARRAARADRPDRSRLALGGVAVVVLLVVGWVDQTPSGMAWQSSAARFQAYDEYFGQIESSLEPGDWVVQLPYQEFPEAHTATGSDANDVLIPYLHTTSIGWTGGGLRGRPEADWTRVLQGLESDSIPAIAAAAGGSGILLDSLATPRPQWTAWSTAFDAALGEPLRSSDGRYSYWALDGVPPAEVSAVTPEMLATLLQGRQWAP